MLQRAADRTRFSRAELFSGDQPCLFIEEDTPRCLIFLILRLIDAACPGKILSCPVCCIPLRLHLSGGSFRRFDILPQLFCLCTFRLPAFLPDLCLGEGFRLTSPLTLVFFQRPHLFLSVLRFPLCAAACFLRKGNLFFCLPYPAEDLQGLLHSLGYLCELPYLQCKFFFRRCCLSLRRPACLCENRKRRLLLCKVFPRILQTPGCIQIPFTYRTDLICPADLPGFLFCRPDPGFFRRAPGEFLLRLFQLFEPL